MKTKLEAGNRKSKMVWSLALLLLLACTSAVGQQNKIIELKKIETKIYYPKLNFKLDTLKEPPIMGGFISITVITAPRIPISLNTPAPVMKLHPEDLQRDDNLSITPALNRIPGVYMQSGTLSTNRISIRGIGSRSPFGTAKIRAYLDDIPLTSGVGETSLEDIDLSLLQEVEIFKGPTASVYGAGLGGLIHLKSLNLADNQPSTAFSQAQVGSFGLLRNVIGVHLNSNKAQLNFNYNFTKSNGYRDNNRYDRDGFTTLGKFNVIKNGITTLLANYTRVKGFIPSSLNKSDFETNPRKAATIWANIKGYEEYDKILTGLSHQQSLSQKFSNTTSLFTTWRDAYEPRPFGILDENSLAIGGRTNFRFQPTEGQRYNMGGEVFSEKYDWQNYRIRQDATKDTLLQDNQEKRFYYNLFAEAEWRWNKWTVNTGVNINQTNYNLTDRFLRDGNDLSGEYNFKTIVSPRIGIVYRPKDNINVYGTVSHGFSPPTLEETLTPSGAINRDIQPEQGWNFEMGSRGSNIGGKLSYEITFYTMQIKDLLVARRTAIDQFIGVNAGKTTHNGIEVYLHYDILNSKILQIFTGYTFADYKFDDFIDDKKDYSGNRLTGTSPHIASAGLDFNEPKTGLYGNLTFQFTDAIPLNDANAIYSNAYKLLNSKIGWRKNLGSKWNLDIYAGLNNLLDEKYASMLQINAIAPAFRYYYPGLPRNGYGGLMLGYKF